MKIWITLIFAAFAGLASAQCPPCETMKLARCDGNGCPCSLTVSNTSSVPVNCKKLVPKCFFMQAEMYNARVGLKTRTIGRQPVDSVDEIYNPECENNGQFKAKQCNNNEECWCVNSAGIRRTDKGERNLTCDELVKTVLVSLRLTHKSISTALDRTRLEADIKNGIDKHYMKFNKDLVTDVKYDSTKRSIVVNLKMTNQTSDTAGTSDLAGMAYYIEKDVKVRTLFTTENWFESIMGSHRLEMENVTVNYIDEKPPIYHVRLSNIYPSVITVVIVMVVVILVGGLCYYRKRRRYL